MNGRWADYVRRIKEQKKRKKRLSVILTALSVAVSGTVGWTLRSIGSALTDDNLPEEHILAETLSKTDPAVWESGLPDCRDEHLAERIARVAESQLGVTEDLQDFILDTDGKTHLNATKYGAWYGNPYGAWNTMFSCFCLYYGGADSEKIPFAAGCWAWTVALENAALLIPAERGSPERGGIVFLDSSGDGCADRSAVIIRAPDDTQEITVIEGDADGVVAEKKYLADSSLIIGYLLPDDDAARAEKPPPEPDDTCTGTTFSESTESGISVIVSADAGIFPENTVMHASDIPYSAVKDAAAEILDAQMLDAAAVDISFCDADGTEIEPEAGSNVNVQIILPEEQILAEGDYALLHITDNGNAEIMEDAVVSESGAAFSAESFSVYVVTSSGSVSADYTVSNEELNGTTWNQKYTADNPLFLYQGQTVTFSETLTKADYDARKEANGGWLTFTVRSGAEHVHNLDDGSAEADGDNMILTKSYMMDTTGDVVFNTPSGAQIYARIAYTPFYLKNQNGEYLPLNLALKERDDTGNYQPGDSATIYAYQGEQLDLRIGGDTVSLYTDWNGVLTCGPTAYDSGTNMTDVSVTCNKYGTSYIDVNGVRVNVVVRHPIYVKNALGERDIDEINEWLPDAYAPKRNGYIPNQFNEYWVPPDYSGPTPGRLYPYYMRPGDTLEFSAETAGLSAPHFEIDYLYFTSVYENGQTTDSLYGSTYDPIFREEQAEPGEGRIGKKYTATKPGYAKITLMDGWDTVRTMYVQVIDPHKLLDHADIEIADDGYYTVTEMKQNSDGSYVKTVKHYQAYVHEINRSTLYRSANETCTFYQGDGSPTDNILGVYEGISGYEQEDYWKDPAKQPSDPQYEYTSKYAKNAKGEYTRWSDKKFYLDDVDHAVFDTDLELIPYQERVICYDKNGNVQSDTGFQDVPDKTPQYAEHILFRMDQRDVLDAYNKCPNHTGLDFTIQANKNAAMVQPAAKKALTNGTLRDQQFSFELVNISYYAEKLGDLGYGPQTKPVNACFDMVNPDDKIEAYQLMKFTDLGWGSGFDQAVLQNELSQYNNLISFGELIDRFRRGETTDPTENGFYDIMSRYLIRENAVQPAGETFTLDAGFLLYRKESVVQTVKNKADGSITFSDMMFMEPGVYHYYIREIPSDDGNVLHCDSSLKPVTVTVSEDRTDGSLWASLSYDGDAVPEFSNTLREYRLPATGGCGTAPFMIAGLSMIAGAFLLLAKKLRRREEQ